MEGYETDALTLGEEWERFYAAISDERDEVEEVMLYRHLYMAGASAALQLMGRTANATVPRRASRWPRRWWRSTPRRRRNAASERGSSDPPRDGARAGRGLRVAGAVGGGR